MASKMVSLKLSKKEAKGELGVPCTADSDKNLPRYPYGTRLRLETEVLEKLGVTPGDFKVGEKLTVTATVEVVGVSMSERQGGKDRNEVELQITDLGMDLKAKQKQKAADEHLNSISGASSDNEE